MADPPRGQASRRNTRYVTSAIETATRKIVLMGGPCSGQTHRVVSDSTAIVAHDAAGHAHTYVRTGLSVDVDDGARWDVFRRRAD